MYQTLSASNAQNLEVPAQESGVVQSDGCAQVSLCIGLLAVSSHTFSMCNMYTLHTAHGKPCRFPCSQAALHCLSCQAWNLVLEASDFPSTVPEDAELTPEQWAEYISLNIGRECPAPAPGDEDRIRAKGWPSWRAYQALKRVANW